MIGSLIRDLFIIIDNNKVKNIRISWRWHISRTNHYQEYKVEIKFENNNSGTEVVAWFV